MATPHGPTTGTGAQRSPPACVEQLVDHRVEALGMGDDQRRLRPRRAQPRQRLGRGEPVGERQRGLAGGGDDDRHPRVGGQATHQAVAAVEVAVGHLGVDAQPVALLLDGLPPVAHRRAERDVVRDTELAMCRQW